MDKLQPSPPNIRLQELLTIPERQRTEAEWDEINELEITLTPVNRAMTSERGASERNNAERNASERNASERSSSAERNVRRKGTSTPDQFRSRDGTQGKRPLKKLRKRPKPAAPQ